MSPVARLMPLVAVLMLALTYLAVRAAMPDTGRHERILNALRVLALNEAALNRDILRARDGLLRNYDPLVRSVDDLSDAALAIRALDGSVRRARAVEDLRAALNEQETLVESF